MNHPDGPTRVLLSFSSAYADLARGLAADLHAANIEVSYDQWDGGGGLPASQSVPADFAGVCVVLPLLTPSAAAPTWVGDEWKRTIHDEAIRRSIGILPVRGAGTLEDVPEFLRAASQANLAERRAFEVQRLIATIRERSGDTRIRIPDAPDDKAAAAGPLTLPAEPIVLDIGETLAPLFEGPAATRFLEEEVPMVYDGLFHALGVQFPKLRLRFDGHVAPSALRIVFHDVPEAEIEARRDWVLVNDRPGRLRARGFTADPAVNPATGADSTWIPSAEAAAAQEAGLVVWDIQRLLVLLLSTVLQRKAADFVGDREVETILDQVARVFPHLVVETVPNTVKRFVVTDVLRRLLAESVSIRDMRRILLALADWGRFERDSLMLAEYARAALHRQISHQLTGGTNRLTVFLLDPALEQVIRESLTHTATGSYMALSPVDLQRILGAIRQAVGTLPNYVQRPHILTTIELRSSVRRLIATSLPAMHVVAYQDLRPDMTIEPLGRIGVDALSRRPNVTVDGEPLWRDGDAERGAS